MTHKMHVSVDMVVEIDPDRVEEWVEANFDPSEESIVVSDLTAGSAVSAPVVYDAGPHPEDLALQGMEDL